MRPLVVFLLLFAAQSHAQSPEPSAAAVVAKVQKYYDNTRELHARFEQRIESPTRAPTLGAGDVWIKKPGKMRWDYQKPEKKLMVSDGSTLWVYEPEDEQAFKQELRSSTLPSQVSFLIGQGRLTEEFDASKQPGVAGPGEVALKMVPKTGTAAYRYVVFVVDAASGQVKQTIIYGQDGTTNRLSFAGVEQNKGIDDGKFKFAPPAGTRILTPPKPQ
jgi:outer membrane lipoprotein carrier protein